MAQGWAAERRQTAAQARSIDLEHLARGGDLDVSCLAPIVLAPDLVGRLVALLFHPGRVELDLRKRLASCLHRRGWDLVQPHLLSPIAVHLAADEGAGREEDGPDPRSLAPHRESPRWLQYSPPWTISSPARVASAR